MKRAIATITVYVYGDDVNDLIMEATEIEDKINKQYPEGSAKVESLHLKEFGKMGELKEIKL